MTTASVTSRTIPLRKETCLLARTGLYQAGLHEVYAAREGDGAAAAGFALAQASQLLCRKGSRVHIVWARHDALQREAGSIYPPGLMAFGIDPSAVALVRGQTVQDVLQAGLDAARCTTLAAQAPGLPAFEITLLRHRGGMAGQTWILEWNLDTASFEARRPLTPREAAVPGGVAALPANREGTLRQAG
jgi:hypothetical protein